MSRTATSPHSDEDRERRRKGLKIQRSLQKETTGNKLDDDSDSDVGDIDFTAEIHPIGYYIDDREKMMEEMFSILKGEKLQRILPALLKDYTIEELKADCLVHLLGMSKKRIFAILEGRDLNSSSDSEIEDEPAASEVQRIPSDSSEIQISEAETKTGTRKEEPRHRSKKRKLSVKEDKKPKKSDSPFIVISDDELVDVKPLKEERRTILKLQKERRALKAKIEKRMKKTEKRKMKSLLQDIQVIDDSNDEQEAASDDDDDDDESKGKSLLEILELEMRARAIRALLKNTPNADEPVPVSILNIKPEQNSKIETEINRTIAEVINEKSVPNEQRDLCSPTDDIEISEVCDILTVTIDDDDEDEAEPTSSLVVENTAKLNDKPDDTKKATSVVEDTSKLDDKPENTKKPTSVVEDTSKIDSKLETTTTKDDASWSDRWMQSKGVEEVMKNNKLCANIRKRMRFAKMLKEKQSQSQGNVEPISNLSEEILSNLNSVEESSVAQYELIKSLGTLKPPNGEQTTVADSDEKFAAQTSNEESTKNADSTVIEINSGNDVPTAHNLNPNRNDDEIREK